MIAFVLVLGFRPDGGYVGIVAAMAIILLFFFMMTSTLLLFPLQFISNVFVDPQTLPSWLQGVVDINPIPALVTAARGLIYDTATFEQSDW